VDQRFPDKSVFRVAHVWCKKCPIRQSSTLKAIMPRQQKIPGSSEWAIAVLLVVAGALCWISWRIGSPMLSGIRDVDIKEELLNLQGPSATPDFRAP
jgi:hypothetical protein